jgi:hypothetical protein
MKMDQAPFPGWLSNSLLRQRNLAIRERLLLFKLLPQEVSFAFGIKSPEQLATAGVLCNLLTRTYGPKPIIDWAMREHKRRSVRAHSPEVMADLPVDPSFTPDEPDAAPTKYLPPHERVEEVTAVDIDFIPFSGEYNANMMLNALDHLVVFYMPWALKRKFSIHSAMDLLWPGTIKKISDYLCLDVMTRSASDQSYRREVNFQEEGE